MLDRINTEIKKHLPDAKVDAFSEDNHHFQVTVVSAAFAGKSLLQQHRMVYDALGEHMQHIHALAIETKETE